MKKTLITLTFILLTLNTLTPFAFSETKSNTGYWALKGTWHTETQKVLPTHIGTTWVAEFADGSISTKKTFKDVSQLVSYEYAYLYTWTLSTQNGAGKEKLYPGDELSVSMTLKYTGIDPKILSGEAVMYAGEAFGFSPPNDGFVRLVNPGGSGSKTVKFPVSKGLSVGDEVQVKVFCEGGYQGLVYVYIYRWVDSAIAVKDPVDEVAAPSGWEAFRGSVGKGYDNLVDKVFPDKSIEEYYKNHPAGYVENGADASFVSITGAVEICPDPDEFDWDRCTFKTMIKAGDHIATRQGSTAIVRFPDGNTLVMPPETEIVYMGETIQRSKLELVLGRLKVNAGKILRDGSMDLVTSQAAASIKGTDFVLEAYVDKTVLKVFAGTVAFSLKSNGDTVDVSAGQQVTAGYAALSVVSAFDMVSEQEEWDGIIKHAWAEQVTQTTIIPGVIIMTALVLLFVVVVKVRRGRK